MYSIKELQEQLLVKTEPAILGDVFGGKGTGIVVFKQYRFHKQLSIELYKAATTLSGKIKNPLTPVNPQDVLLKVADPNLVKYYSAISRFQNNPTAPRSPLDIDALKIILQNPQQLRYFYHNADFSNNVVAGSLTEISPGTVITHVQLYVNKKQNVYEVILHVDIEGKTLRLNEVEVKYDYLILHNGRLHLLGKFPFVNLVRFFRQHPAGLSIHQSAFGAFKEQILDRLEDHVAISYTYVQAATESLNTDKTLQRIIYLSDMHPYVAINPVMQYDDVEIPVLSRRQLFVKDDQGNTIAFKRNDEAETRFLAMLLLQYPEFAEQAEGDLTYFYVHKDRFLDEEWFLEAFEQWRQEGVLVLGFNEIKGNKLNAHKASVSVQVTSGLNWFNSNIDVRFGKQRASLKSLQRAVRNRTKYVQLDDGTLGILPHQWLEKIAAFFAAGEIVDDTLHVPKVQFPTVKELYEEHELDEEVKTEIALYETKLTRFDAIEEVEVPEGLNAELRSYQKQGLQWLNFLDDHNFGGCLADDMGLGKTLQIIAFILLQRKKAAQNTNLVVVPTSLIFNWQAEVEKFAPSIKIHTLYGANRVRQMKDLAKYELVLTTYGSLLSDAPFLQQFTFNYIFLDESQHIKNVTSQRYASVRLLKSRNKIVITGTPVENNTLDLYAQLSFACPGLLGSKHSFRDLFSIPIDKFQSSRNLKELQQKIAPFVLRRTKQEVAEELPEKTEMVLYCPMGEAQRKIYERNEQELRDLIEGKTDDELAKSSMHVLKGLTRLRQICNSPLLLEDEKAFEDHSSKVEILMEQVALNAPNHKILIFSQFVSMLKLIQKELERSAVKYAMLTGSTTNREQVVNRFRNDEEVRVFLISLKAGGTGLNLTEADYVYLVDPWWNPAVENQAIDRSYRIGQKKNVIAVRLICPDTLEEKIQKLQASKRGLSDALIKTEQTFFSSFSKAEWLALFNHNSGQKKG